MKRYLKGLTRCYPVLFILLISSSTFSQQTITGIVTDKNTNETLIGATVQIKGKSTNGTVTDINGKYRISANSQDILVFTYIGMIRQEISVGSSSIINVALNSSSINLGEVVAIGYGTIKKSDLTGSVSVVTTKELTKNPSASAAEAIQGKAAGVLVTNTGQPGAGISIRIRGVGSINNSSDPIYILDGIRVSDINGIQPQDIENFQVLKDASATAIYGSNGSNGVIIVNTKRGVSGKPVIVLNSYLTMNTEPKHLDVMNASQYANFLLSTKYKDYGINQTYVNNMGQIVNNPAYSLSTDFRQKYYGTGWSQGTDWQNQLFKNSMSQNHVLSVSGGGEKSNYNVSLSYNDDQGNVIKSSAQNYTIRANSDFKITNFLKIGENFSGRYTTLQQPTSVQSSIWDLTVSPLMRVYNSSYTGGFESPQTTYWIDNFGNLSSNAISSLSYTNTLGNDKVNPLCSVLLGSNNTKTTMTNASFYAQIDFTPWLLFKSTPSISIINAHNTYWMPLFTGNRANSAALLSEAYSSKMTLNLENQLLFNKNINDIHNLQATLVQQVHQELTDNSLATVTGFNNENLNTLSNGGAGGTEPSVTGGRTDYRELSYLARVIYDYKGKYFATISTRRDGVSSFAPDYRIGYFSAGSLAWKVNEDFFKSIKEISLMKLRIGWGQTGNSQTNGSYYEYYDQITSMNNFSPVFGNNQQIANAQYIFYGMGSPYYHWETSEMTNIGLDLNLFNGKLQSSFEYYIKNVNDLLIQKPISDAYGRYQGDPWVNLGALQNKGVEINIQWRDKIGEIEYGITTNFATTKNTVKALAENSPITIGNNQTSVGNPVGYLYGYVSEGIIQSNNDYTHFPKQNGVIPQPGDIRYKDLNGDGIIDSNDRTMIGNTIPGISYSIGFDASYKGFDFNLFLNGVGDYQIYNQQRASLSSVNSQDMDHNKLVSWAENYWTPENASTKFVRYDASNTNLNDQISTFWIEDGSFLRIKNIQIGYTVPAKECKKISVSNLRIYASASNLYCFTKYQGRDPESFMSTTPLTSGTDNGSYTIPKSFTFGLQIGF